MKIFAYIDPGTGSLFLQALAGSILAVSVAFRGVIRSTLGKFRNNASKNKMANDEKK